MNNSIIHSDKYEFGSIIKDALDKVALPVMKRSLQQALSSCLPPGEIYGYVHGIMTNYKFYNGEALNKADPVGGFTDFTALWFLLFPYKEGGNDAEAAAYEELEGAADRYLIPYFSLTSSHRFMLSYLRRIRNVCAHNEGKQRITEKNPELVDEYGALGFIEKALAPLDANVSEKLREYRDELEQKIQKHQNKPETAAIYDNEKQRRLNIYVSKMEQDRKIYAFQRTREHPYMAAPIGKPYEGTPPWTESDAFVTRLRWPSRSLALKQSGNQTPGHSSGSTPAVTNAAGTAPSQKTNTQTAVDPHENIPVYSVRRKEYIAAAERAAELFRANDFAAAFPLMQTAASHGHAASMYSLSIMWFNGLGVNQKNDRISLTWMQKAAYEGYVPAFQALVFKYYNGIGTAPDGEEARFWAQKALDADPDLLPIQQILTSLGGRRKPDPYELNIGIMAYQMQQYHEAVPRMLQQAYAGDALACYNLSVIYIEGKGIEKNMVQSFRWMHEAALLGYPDAYDILINKYMTGKGTAVNIEKAYSWLQIAKQQGAQIQAVYESMLNKLRSDDYHYNPDMLKLISLWADYGHVQESFEATYHAAMAGNNTCMNKLSEMYAKGIGIAADQGKSKYWKNKLTPVNYLVHNPMKAVMSAEPASLVKSADRKQAIDDYCNGDRLFQQKKYVEALPYLERAGKAGHGQALYRLAFYHLNGYAGIRQDLDFGRDFMFEAFARGSEWAKHYAKTNLNSFTAPYWVLRYLNAEPNTENILQNMHIEQAVQFFDSALEMYEKSGIITRCPVTGNQDWFPARVVKAFQCGNVDALCFIEDHLPRLEMAALIGHSYAWYKLGAFFGKIGDIQVSDRCYIESAKRGYEEAKTICQIKNLMY